MHWGFEIGKTYNRRQDIHARFEGQRQGGIITPANHPLVVVITGEEGLAHGYADRYRPDGVFEYFGEGQRGDMEMKRGNYAILTHSQEGKSLLLFRKTPSGLRFENEMICEGYHFERGRDSEGQERQAIVFEMRPLEAVAEAVSEMAPSTGSLSQLRERAYSSATHEPGETKTATRTIYERSKDVRDYVLARASGVCESCAQSAPFNRKDGSPYLEPHHLRRRSDGGPDHPAFVIATCPTCHRRVHFGQDGDLLNQELLGKMATIEKPFDTSAGISTESA